MLKSTPLVLFLFVVSVLFTAGFVCNQSDSGTASNSTSTSGNTSSASSPTPAKSTPKDISGNYDATGTNENGGSPYKASLVVTPHDNVYQFTWASSGKTYDGVGVMTDNAVGVSFTEGSSGKGCGVVLYKIGSDGSLDGKTGYWGVNTAETEKGTRKSGSDLEGKYDISGQSTEGKAYNGTLDVKREGEGYVFTWNAGNTFSGYGVKTGDKAVIGFGGKQCSFVSYEVKSDGTLEGKWGGQSTKSFGTETAKKK